MTASLRVKNDKYYVVLTHTTDGKKNQTWVSTGLTVTGNEGVHLDKDTTPFPR